MSGHTPGPWKVTPDSWVMTDTNPSQGIAKIITHVVGFPENARLIAAAPDLLEACRKALAILHYHNSNVTAASVEAAIAKAEGK